MSARTRFPFGNRVAVPINGDDFIDITATLDGQPTGDADSPMEGWGVLMKMYDVSAVAREMIRTGASEQAAKSALTPAYIVFSISRGRPAFVLMSPDGRARAEIVIEMVRDPRVDVWDYASSPKDAAASVAFPPYEHV